MSAEVQLKPCPFCGGEARCRDFPELRHVSHYVECTEGPCDVTMCAGDTEAEAIAAWNTRTSAQAESARLIALACEALEILVGSVDDLINDSGGVYGLHLNGDPAPWDSLTQGGQFEAWLLGLEDARATLAALRAQAPADGEK